MTEEELVRRLRPIVEAATPGPRRMYNGWGPDDATRVERIGHADVTVFECSVNSDICARKADFEYIAALDPETVSALLDTIERLSSDLAAAQKERDEFGLTIQRLSAPDGPWADLSASHQREEQMRRAAQRAVDEERARRPANQVEPSWMNELAAALGKDDKP